MELRGEVGRAKYMREYVGRALGRGCKGLVRRSRQELGIGG